MKARGKEMTNLEMRKRGFLSVSIGYAAAPAGRMDDCRGSGDGAMMVQEISGDTAVSCRLPDGSLAMILSDGMGKGPQAAAESRLVVGMLRKKLKQGCSVSNAIKEVNIHLLGNGVCPGGAVKLEKESFATVDLTIVDCQNGRARFYKMGAAPSYVVRGRREDAGAAGAFRGRAAGGRVVRSSAAGGHVSGGCAAGSSAAGGHVSGGCAAGSSAVEGRAVGGYATGDHAAGGHVSGGRAASSCVAGDRAAGGGADVALRRVRKLEKPALPVGIIPTLKLTHVTARLHTGDIIVMMSDGVADMAGLGNDDWIGGLLAGVPAEEGPRQLAGRILREAQARCGAGETDDATVMVAIVR